ncbi:hypothetical protein ABZ260_45605 [Streptosporangium sp. NPDC006013]|uniref:hypothetical protein n=1 Tax=Streptosporangium sp. NPDC006013 TaxID=3155596 RepID=UPI0033A37787
MAVSLLTPMLVFADSASARAAPTDPVTALKRQFRSGHGVKVSETTRIDFGEGEPITTRRHGRLQFGPSGLIARDTTQRVVTDTAIVSPQRTIIIDGQRYLSGGSYDLVELPEGKEWVRSAKEPQAIGAAYGDETLNLFELVTLKTLLRSSARSRSASLTSYRGSISYSELYRLSRSFRNLTSRPTGDFARIRIGWRLWTDGTGLVNRVVTKTEYPKKWSLTMKSDTRYTGWGSRMTIAPPPPGQIVDEKDLKSGPGLEEALAER